jgi:vancomycin resistance protein YoaR
MAVPRAALLGGGALAAVLALGYGGSFLVSGDKVPRGVHVAGVDLSGRTEAQARTILNRELADEAGAPLQLVADDVELRLVPATAGLRVDVEATVDEARSAGPLDRLRGLLGTRRDVDPKPQIQEEALKTALAALAPKVDREPREGTIPFTGVTPTAVDPEIGRSLDLDGAVDAIRADYLRKPLIELPVEEEDVKSTSETVQEALESVARPAVASPITVAVEGKSLVVQPADVAAGLSFEVDDDGDLKPSVDGKKVLTALGTRVAAVEVKPRDATFDVGSGKPVLVPAKEGRTIAPDALAKALTDVLTDAAPRRTSLSLTVGTPRVTTEVARTLNVKEVIGTFTTRHPCCAPRVTNIHTIADIVDGYVVLPGETFDLNKVVGKRDRARGFVPAPQILRGQFVQDVGGGVSQFATTMFNAVFFSGLKDVEHHPHSYYISRYPPGREATVSFPQPDLKWQNDSPDGVLVKTSYTQRSITVTFWGTKRYEIESVTGERTRIKPFGKEYVDRDDCTPASGAEGFDIVVTRVFKKNGVVIRREPFKTRYLPEPNFICGPPPPGQPAKQPPPSS